MFERSKVQPLSLKTLFIALNLLLLGFSGGDAYYGQAYDRIFVTTEQLNDLELF